jgi:hypothetical protein
MVHRAPVSERRETCGIPVRVSPIRIGGAVGIVATGVQVGHSGGLLVYRHGAASAYTDALPGRDGGIGPATAGAMAKPDGRNDRDDRDSR